MVMVMGGDLLQQTKKAGCPLDFPDLSLPFHAFGKKSSFPMGLALIFGSEIVSFG